MMYFLQGFSIGLAYVAPIGSQNLFVINTGLTQPTKRVYQTAFIVMFFDITLALACFFGVGALMDRFNLLKMAIMLIGSLVLVYMGVTLAMAKGSMERKDVNMPLKKVISMACVVTWFNPQALIDGSMMLGAFKTTLPAGTDAFFVGGFASASVIWFLGISTVISIFSAKITDKVLRIINIICGIVIIFYGVKLFVNFIQILIA